MVAPISASPSPTSPSAPTFGTVETRARNLLVASAVVLVAGVLLAGTVSRDIGGGLVLLGWALGIYGLHTFGRLGRESTRTLPSGDAGPAREGTTPPDADPS